MWDLDVSSRGLLDYGLLSSGSVASVLSCLEGSDPFLSEAHSHFLLFDGVGGDSENLGEGCSVEQADRVLEACVHGGVELRSVAFSPKLVVPPPMIADGCFASPPLRVDAGEHESAHMAEVSVLNVGILGVSESAKHAPDKLVDAVVWLHVLCLGLGNAEVPVSAQPSAYLEEDAYSSRYDADHGAAPEREVYEEELEGGLESVERFDF